ncbi:peptidase inhibitor family I36 protein [Luteipulveratus flavus]|uniref:Peptidase inhibitor family I36 protein n=1 Tax=Luteipulveratus flavus TaxID=3031728 RepID=A0ABT6C9M2_9MICO|nr:peptidase inhibitor family I36 protein [Luteipulveratus sp. YIM 133296]MDF8265612.1 peptidase inhibitor family I36 protein [Luteipulveratus sp. YIM 133296]
MSRTRRSLAVAAAVTALTGGLAVTAMPSAQAASRDGVCDSGEFCYYYNSDFAGSISDFTSSVSDYGTSQPDCYEFKGPGNGQGLCIKNNAASVWNRTSSAVTVYYNSGYAGSTQTIASGGKVNLNATLKNNNASHRIGSTSGTENLSYGLYDASGGRITCGFDGYVNTPGRHEGIDIARGIGSPVRALIGGKVINVVRGANGSSGLSTIAVYNATYDKTIVYLHSAPLSSVTIGDTVNRDQQIATEAWRGVSSSSGAHTHVEMRLGQHTLAAKSVNDPVLDNPNPTSFWEARGYNVR